MKERPILFSAWMVRAILEGRKKQTRRVVKDQPPANCACLTQSTGKEYPDKLPRWAWTDGATQDYAWHPWIGDEPAWQTCPFGVPGDRLWVRETAIISPKGFCGRSECEWTHEDVDGDVRVVQYLATQPNRDGANNYQLKATPSIFMSRWASRITLEITDVRVQRLQDISEEDAEAEGADSTKMTEQDIAEVYISDCAPYVKELAQILGPGEFMAKHEFAMIWDVINAKKHPWISNPWVWAIAFKRVEAAA